MSTDGIAPYLKLAAAGLVGAGIGAGGNQVADRAGHNHEQFKQILESQKEAQAMMIDLLKNDIRRETLAQYWMQELERMQKIHTAGRHPHMTNSAR